MLDDSLIMLPQMKAPAIGGLTVLDSRGAMSAVLLLASRRGAFAIAIYKTWLQLPSKTHPDIEIYWGFSRLVDRDGIFCFQDLSGAPESQDS